MLQFILGNSGAGKSHYLYEKIIQESMKHPEINYLVIVPEQFTMQTQQDLCILHPNHGNFVKGGRSIPYFHPISHPFYEKHRRRIWCFPVSPDQKSN